MNLSPSGWRCFAWVQTRQANTPVGGRTRGRELKVDDGKLLVNPHECCIVDIHTKFLRRLSLYIYIHIYSAKKETHMWFNRNFFRYGVYMTETTIYDWNQQFVRNQNLFVNLLLCETGVCSGPLSATRSITCVATSCFLHCSASAWHGWNQTCNLCMWDVIPGLLDSQTQLWEGLRRWVTWPYASINKVPQMLDRGQVGGLCWPGQYLDSISSQKVLCEAGRVRASIILLKR